MLPPLAGVRTQITLYRLFNHSAAPAGIRDATHN